MMIFCSCDVPRRVGFEEEQSEKQAIRAVSKLYGLCSKWLAPNVLFDHFHLLSMLYGVRPFAQVLALGLACMAYLLLGWC
jgi:hypothetical protein